MGVWFLMEAATAPLSLLAQRRARAFERECERLRPLGEAYVARRFGGSLNRADGEDVVAEVLIRLHRQAEAGDPPRNLRAAFFTSVRNAAIDLLRARSARPTAPLEAASSAESGEVAPEEWAEGREDAVRLQEALGRMRGNYREAILLRFGLGLTVPEMAAHLGISLPAAKKLVLRATRQVAQRLESIEGEDFCDEMREAARQSLFEREASGLASAAESEVLRAHFAHCGSCKSYLMTLHGTMHDIGAAAVLGLGGVKASGVSLGALDRVAEVTTTAVEGAQTGVGRVRHVLYRAANVLPGSDVSSAGALIGTGQKIAAICTAGAATTATCLLTGAVGPGIGATAPSDSRAERPAQTRTAEEPAEASVPVAVEPAPVTEAPPAVSEGGDGGGAAEAPSPPPAVAEPTPAPVAQPESAPPRQEGGEAVAEFGVESAARGPASTRESAPAPPPPSSEFGGAGGSTSAPSTSSGGGEVGGATTPPSGGSTTSGSGGGGSSGRPASVPTAEGVGFQG